MISQFTASIIRKKWIDFFQSKDHHYLPPLSLIPDHDNSLLFVNSGVAAIKEYFIGNLKLPKQQIVNCQKVVRTNDIENIGITSRHNSFFEMLGNFSINSYFKKSAVTMAIDFLTNHLDMDLKNLYFTIFDQDKETINIYLESGIPRDHLLLCGEDRNFWDMGNGPCGPCTEIYYDRGDKYDPKNIGIKLLEEDIENDRYIEIWNIVFSEFINNNGTFDQSTKKNIDTGAGLERLLTIKEEANNNFENSLFLPIIKKTEEYSPIKYQTGSDSKTNSLYQIIADHLRSTIMILSEGISFGNKDREYIVRKLFRRALSSAFLLNTKTSFLIPSTKTTIQTLSDFYPQLLECESQIISQIQEEQRSFQIVLEKSEIYIEKLINNKSDQDIESQAFTLVERHGVPFDLITQALHANNIQFSQDKYQEIFQQHKSISKNTKFKDAFETYNKDQTYNETEIIYDSTTLDGIEIIKIYDEQLKEVKSLKNQIGYLVFKKTIFFPDIAGQESDSGTINISQVKEVLQNKQMEILHKVDSSIWSCGDIVKLTIDFDKRNGISMHHTTEHIVYALIQRHIYEKSVRESAKKTHNFFKLSFSINTSSEEQILDIERLSNEIIKKKIAIDTRYADAEECESLNLDYKKLIHAGKATDKFRVVKIGDLSAELCIGTHVSNTSQLEKIMIKSLVIKKHIYEIEVLVGQKKIQDFLDKTLSEWQKLMPQTTLNIDEQPFLIQKRLFQQKQQEHEKNSRNAKNEKQISDIESSVNQSNSEIIQLKDFDAANVSKFLKTYQLPSHLENLIIFLDNDKNKLFFIVGNATKASEILLFLKTNFNAFGGGHKIICGNLNLTKKTFLDIQADFKKHVF